MLDKILSAVQVVFGVLKTILGFFRKTPEAKLEQAEKGVRDEMDKFKKDGRPSK